MKLLELGVVYKRGRVYFMAVDDDLLMRASGTTLQVNEQTVIEFKQQRRFSVDDLATAWHLTLDELDGRFTSYFMPKKRKQKEGPW